jgi:hypothetical protein
MKPLDNNGSWLLSGPSEIERKVHEATVSILECIQVDEHRAGEVGTLEKSVTRYLRVVDL